MEGQKSSRACATCDHSLPDTAGARRRSSRNTRMPMQLKAGLERPFRIPGDNASGGLNHACQRTPTGLLEAFQRLIVGRIRGGRPN